MNRFQILKPGSDQYSIIHPNDLEIYLRNGDITITEDELKDKSKGDWLSKSILTLQITWFILQILVRVVQHLAITELEIAPLAFAIINFMTSFFWRNKPFDVDCPIIIPAYHEPGTWDAGSSSSQDRPTPEVRSSSVQDTEGNLIVGRDFPFSCSHHYKQLIVDCISCGAATVFGVTHCLAWHFEFSSKTEQLLWRISSTATSCLPIFVLVSVETSAWLKALLGNSPRLLRSLQGVCNSVRVTSVAVYLLARLFLLVDMFVVLRKPNSGIFTSVDWIDNIPHI
ncbi:hypothetical protein J132_07824 [Termitomyces sp. J132]|nr:hypothetical protein J132_07824 [Termitomyces sp. J132]